MSRYETIRRQHCAHCDRTTAHNLTVYDDEKREIVYCTECGK